MRSSAHDQILKVYLQPHHGQRLRECTVRVRTSTVFHAAAIDRHFAAPNRRLRMNVRGIDEITASKSHASHRAGRAADEISASRHFILRNIRNIRAPLMADTF